MFKYHKVLAKLAIKAGKELGINKSVVDDYILDSQEFTQSELPQSLRAVKKDLKMYYENI